MQDKPKKRKRKGERPDGLIQVSLKIGYKPDGTPDRKYFYGHTRAEAERKRDAFRTARENGNLSPDITVKEWVAQYLITYRKRVKKAYTKSDDVPYNRLSEALGYMRVADVREYDLQNALNKVEGMSFSTIDKYRQAMRRVFKRAQKNKLISDNPAEDLVMPEYTKGTHRALERWEIELVINNWNTPASHAGLWVMLMLLCGLRRGEMMALDWKDVDLDARMLHVTQVAVIEGNAITLEERAKTNAGLRILPICNILHAALSTVPEEQRVGPVCLSAHGLQLTEKSVRRGMDTFCKVMSRIINGEPISQRGRRTDIEKKKAEQETLPALPRTEISFTSHDLRHTYATSLYDAGVPVKAAQYFLGHADIRITLELYTHLSKEREAASRNQLVKHLDEWLDSRVLAPIALPSFDEK